MGWSSVLSKWAPFTTVLQSQNCPSMCGPHMRWLFFIVSHAHSWQPRTGVVPIKEVRTSQLGLGIMRFFVPRSVRLSYSNFIPLPTLHSLQVPPKVQHRFHFVVSPIPTILLFLIFFYFYFVLFLALVSTKTKKKKLVVNHFCFVMNF